DEQARLTFTPVVGTKKQAPGARRQAHESADAKRAGRRAQSSVCGTLKGSHTPREGLRRAKLASTHAQSSVCGTLKGSHTPREGLRRAKLASTHATDDRTQEDSQSPNPSVSLTFSSCAASSDTWDKSRRFRSCWAGCGGSSTGATTRPAW